MKSVSRNKRGIYKFIAGYLVFYAVIVFSVPMQATGTWLRPGIFGFFQAFLPYLLLEHFFPDKKNQCITGIAMTIFVSYCLSYAIERAFRPVSLNQYIDETYPLLIAVVLYGILFFFARYSALKALDEQQQQIRNYDAILDQYRGQLPKETLFKQLDKIEELVNNQSPEALAEIADLSKQLRGLIYQ